MNKLLTILLLTLFAAFMFHNVVSITQDLGRHLKTGQIIFETKSIPKTNLFSYTEPDFPFINHHWASELVFYLLYKAGGFNVLILFKLFLNTLAFGLVFLTFKRDRMSPWAFLSAYLAIRVFAERTAIRPEIFSYLFTAIFFKVLNDYNTGRKNRLALLLPIQLAWANLHILFVLGLGLVLCLALALRFEGKRERSAALFKFLLLLFIVCAINPYGIRGALAPFTILNEYGYDIVENQSPFYLARLIHLPSIFYFKVYLIFFWLTFLAGKKRPEPFHFCAGLFVTVLAYRYVRGLPIFALIALPISIANLDELKLKFLQRRHFGLAISTLVAVGLFFNIYSLGTNNYYFALNQDERFGFGVVKGMSGAAKFILENNISGEIFNNFDNGGNLVWHLYPKYRVFVDGRPEAYSLPFFKFVYIPMQENADLWGLMADKFYRINCVLFSHTDNTIWAQAFLRRLFHNPGWALVYLDDYAVLFLRSDERNRDIINKYALTAKHLEGEIKGWREDAIDVLPMKRRVRFFQIVGLNDLALEGCLNILKASPEDSETNRLVGLMYKDVYRDLDKAFFYLCAARRRDFFNPALHNAIGECLAQRGELEGARRAFLLASLVGFGYVPARANLVKLRGIDYLASKFRLNATW